VHVSRALDDMLNRAPNRHAPYVGESAFTTKTGIHASAIAKDPATYEHVAPQSIGNTRKVLVSDQAGRSNLMSVMPTSRPMRRWNFWRARRSAACPSISASSSSTSMSSSASTRSAIG
jgi:hypothetical protein